MNDAQKRPAWLQFVRENWLFTLIFIGLIIFPHFVGWITDSSPFGVMRGSNRQMRGESVFWMSVFIEVFALAVLVMSYNLMFGFTGVISFGHALFYGLGGYIIGMMWTKTSMDGNLALGLAVVAVLVITGAVSFFVGLASLRLRGVYFAIFTLAVAEMAFIFVGRWAVTNGEDGLSLSDIPEWIDPSRSRINLYYIGLALFVFTFLFIRRLINSPTGAVFQAIRENEPRAQAIGYHTLRFKLLSITIAGMLAGMAGMLQAILNKKLGPDMFGVSHTVDALLMTIIGGVGTFTGPVLGAAGLHLADTEFRDLQLTLGSTVINVGDRWLLILGFIFILTVLAFPFGVVGTWKRLQARFSR
jgi:branched-chain amino acid transport system permease protein